MRKKIVFFIETGKELGGDQKFFYNLAAELSNADGYDVCFVNDYDEVGQFEKLNEISLKDFDAKKFSDAIFCCPINYAIHLLAEIKNYPNTKLCFYSYSGDACKWVESGTGIKNIANSLSELSKNNCVYLNSDCFCSADEEEISEKRVYNEDDIIAAFINDENEKYRHSKKLIDNEIDIGVCLDSVESYWNRINALLRDFIEEEDVKRIKVHTLGGIRRWIRFDSVKNIRKDVSIQVVYNGESDKRKWLEYLCDNADFVIASGETALSAAACGIPVYVPVIGKENEYRKFYELQNGNLNASSKNEQTSDENIEIRQIYDEIYLEKKGDDIGKETLNFVEKYHDGKVLAKKFLSFIEKCDLTVHKCLSEQLIRLALQKYEDYKENKKTIADYREYLTTKASETTFENKLASFNKQQKSYREKVLKITKKYVNKKIPVAFLVVFKSVFPAKPIFEKMINDNNFDPYIIVLPQLTLPYTKWYKQYVDAYNELRDAYGERVINGYDSTKGKFVDLYENYPIMFFANPYDSMVHPYHKAAYYLNRNVLPIYVSYGFAALKFWDEVIAMPFYNYMWKCTLETESNLEHLKQTEIIKGRNGVVTGYLKMDKLADIVPQKHARKRIMICPHHTVWGSKSLNIGNFITYAEYFQKLPKMFPEVDFVFRPHPLLLSNLRAHKVWTQEQIDKYMERLLSNSNLAYDTSGDYMQAFADSDAMIHDCGSFIGEYLYTMKPCCYMLKSEEAVNTTLVPLGQKCMEQYYRAFCEEDITKFIREVVIGGADPLKEQREAFAKNELMVNYPHAADAFIDILKKELKRK